MTEQNIEGSDDETMQDVREDINELADISQQHDHPGFFNKAELTGLAQAIADTQDRLSDLEDTNRSE